MLWSLSSLEWFVTALDGWKGPLRGLSLFYMGDAGRDSGSGSEEKERKPPGRCRGNQITRADPGLLLPALVRVGPS